MWGSSRRRCIAAQVICTVSLDGCCFCCHFGMKMAFSPRIMGVSSYNFRSNRLLNRWLSGYRQHCLRAHFRGHCIAKPTAQRQQGDHEDK